MGRPAWKRISEAARQYLEDDPRFLQQPTRIQRYVERWVENAEHIAGGSHLKELNLRAEGHVPKDDSIILPPSTFILQPIRQIEAQGAVVKRPELPMPEMADFGAKGASEPESRIELPVRAKPRLMPIIEEPEVTRLPTQEESDVEDGDEE